MQDTRVHMQTSSSWFYHHCRSGTGKREDCSIPHHVSDGLNSLEELLQMVKPLIEKQDTQMRSSIPAKDKLLVTRRYLATDIVTGEIML